MATIKVISSVSSIWLGHYENCVNTKQKIKNLKIKNLLIFWGKKHLARKILIDYNPIVSAQIPQQ